MKALILAGGFGTRLSEETDIKPKPMVEIGGKPILWHIMKIYSYYGINDFVILLGYKGYYIKEYFANYFLHQSSVTIDLQNNDMKIHSNTSEPWRVTLLDTGLHTMTGGRIKQAEPYVGDETFLLTYGDGVADVDVAETIRFHKLHGKALTMTSVQPDSRFGHLEMLSDGKVVQFTEKAKEDSPWINAGFFVCEPKIFEYISDDLQTVFEKEPLEELTKDGELYTYRHKGFWHCMDTLRDNKKLNEMWEKNQAKWKVWK
jgi:glucose-1-phosphate cytidylyltransferase